MRVYDRARLLRSGGGRVTLRIHGRRDHRAYPARRERARRCRLEILPPSSQHGFVWRSNARPWSWHCTMVTRSSAGCREARSAEVRQVVMKAVRVDLGSRDQSHTVARLAADGR